MGNRLKEIRLLRNQRVTKAAEGLGISRGELYKLERGERRLTDVWIDKLATYYSVAPGDLVSEGRLSVPVKHVVGSASVTGPSQSPRDHVEAPGFVMTPEHCFGAFVRDDSANRLYPAGTTVVARRLDKLGRALKRGDRVVMRHYKGSRKEAEPLEDMVGLLDVAVNGDLIVLLMSDNRRLGGAVTVRPAAFEIGQKPEAIAYEPQDEDPGEILGVIVAAIIPQ